MSPSGALASLAQGELYFALRTWQHAEYNEGLVLQDVFVQFPGRPLAPDIAYWSPTRRPVVS